MSPPQIHGVRTVRIQGASAAMIRWPDAMCLRIAEAGRCVIRYDNRDTGRSTAFPPGDPGYDLRDLAQDAVGILDAYGVKSAHVAERVLSATIAASTCDPSAIGSAATGIGGDTAARHRPRPSVD